MATSIYYDQSLQALSPQSTSENWRKEHRACKTQRARENICDNSGGASFQTQPYERK